MLEPDSDTRRMLAHERQHALTRAASDVRPRDPILTESRRAKWRRYLYVPRFRLDLRPARGGS